MSELLSEVLGFGGVALFLAGVYLLFGLATALILAGLLCMWAATRIGNDNGAV